MDNYTNLITYIKTYAQEHKEKTGRNLWLGHDTNYCICGKSVKMIYFPHKQCMFPIELDFDYDHYEFDKVKIHVCDKIPDYKCKNCQDKGFTLINTDRTGQDSNIVRVRCNH